MTRRSQFRTLGLLCLTGVGFCACEQHSNAPRDGSATGSGGRGSGDATASGGAVSVLQHHMNPTRDGVYADPSMTTLRTDAGPRALVHPLKLDSTFSPTIAGNVYAQPLYVTNGPGGKEAFIVVTEQNHVMAIDATGATLWEHPSSPADATQYGPPVTGVAQTLGCGNIDPLGITGTPVIDATSRTIYFDAMTGPTPTHKIYAISLDDGTIKPKWPVIVDTAVTGFVSKTQNERGALALAQGILYVPYGGHDGDCGTYHGWVVGVDVTNPTSATAFSTGTLGTGTANRGGIWAAGGVASTLDRTSLFVSTGNTDEPSAWSGGEAVLRLTAGPAFANQNADEFYPSDWLAADRGDVDLGGANPVVFDMPNAPVPHLVVALGKDGYLYLLNRDNLGGMGGQLSMTAVATQSAGANGALNAAAAVYTTSRATYVAYRINMGTGTGCPAGQTGNLGVAKINPVNPPTATVVWCSTEADLGSPVVTNAGNGDVIVWDANTRLYGYDGDTGTEVFAGGGDTDVMAVGMHRFNSPIDAAGRMVVATAEENGPTAAGGRLYIFRP